MRPQSNKRLERTRHERASPIYRACVGKPLKRMGMLAYTRKKPSMLRNSIAVVGGALLNFGLNIAAARLAWLLIIGNVDRSENKDAFVRLQLWQTFFIVPAISVVVGSVVASMVPRSLWWLGGVAAMPIFIYSFIRGAYVLEIVLSVVYIGLAFAAAYVTSWFKRARSASPHAQQALGADSP